MDGSIYEGPFVVQCAGPGCSRAELMEPGAPGPERWLDLGVWDGDIMHGLGYFCSLACLEAARPTLAGRDSGS